MPSAPHRFAPRSARPRRRNRSGGACSCAGAYRARTTVVTRALAPRRASRPPAATSTSARWKSPSAVRTVNGTDSRSWRFPLSFSISTSDQSQGVVHLPEIGRERELPHRETVREVPLVQGVPNTGRRRIHRQPFGHLRREAPPTRAWIWSGEPDTVIASTASSGNRPRPRRRHPPAATRSSHFSDEVTVTRRRRSSRRRRATNWPAVANMSTWPFASPRFRCRPRRRRSGSRTLRRGRRGYGRRGRHPRGAPGGRPRSTYGIDQQ